MFPNIQDKAKWGAGLSPKRLCFGSGVDGRWSLQKKDISLWVTWADTIIVWARAQKSKEFVLTSKSVGLSWDSQSFSHCKLANNRPMVLIRPGCHNEGPQTGGGEGLKQQKLAVSQLRRTQSLRTRCRRQGGFPLRPLSLAYRWPSPPHVLTWSSLCVSVS